MSDTPAIAMIRAEHHRIMTQPGGAETPLVARCWRCREVWPCHVVTVLAALDEAQSVIAGLTADVQSYQTQVVQPMVDQIARDAPVLAAAEAYAEAEAALDGMIEDVASDEAGVEELLGVRNSAEQTMLALCAARRAATTPTP